MRNHRSWIHPASRLDTPPGHRTLDQSRAAVSGQALKNSLYGVRGWERSNGCCRRYGPKVHSAKRPKPGSLDQGSPRRLSTATLQRTRCSLQFPPSEWLSQRKRFGLTHFSTPVSFSRLLSPFITASGPSRSTSSPEAGAICPPHVPAASSD